MPAGEAVVTTIATKVIEKKEKQHAEDFTVSGIEPFSCKLKRLNGLLWGGSALLAFEHVWHGELQPFFPFLTAAQSPTDTAEMLYEMSTVGVGMAAAVTAVWGIATFIGHKIETRGEVKASKTEEAK